MEFVVLGKHTKISLAELKFSPVKIIQVLDHIALVESNGFDISSLAGITKFGKVIERENIEPKKLIVTNSPVLGKELKTSGKISRFKLADNLSKDIDANENEYIVHQIFGAKNVGFVTGYQNIKLYEQIDFEKPISGMQIGMMPSKLAHLMINIGKFLASKENCTLYDPFVGFGTNLMISNAIGLNAIGSDINITSAKKNIDWREKNVFCTENKILLYKHDVTQKFEKKFLDNVDVIVTESWLGNPIKSFKPQTIEANQKNIIILLEKFLTNCKIRFGKKIPIVFSGATFMTSPEKKLDEIEIFAKNLGYDVERVEQIYARKGQKVGREIFILK